MPGQAGKTLALGHRGAALHPGDDDGLAHAGQGVLGVQHRSGPAKAGYPGRIIVGNAVRIEGIHLLPNRAVQAGVAGVQPHGGFAGGFVLAHYGKHLFQRHFSAVINRAVCLGQPQQGRVDQAARVDDAVCRLQQGRTAPGDKIRCAGACPHKMYHVSFLSSFAAVSWPAWSAPAGRFGWRKALPRL